MCNRDRKNLELHVIHNPKKWLYFLLVHWPLIVFFSVGLITKLEKECLKNSNHTCIWKPDILLS